MHATARALVFIVLLMPLAEARAQDSKAELESGLERFQAATALAEKEEFEEAVKELNEALPHFEKAENPIFLGLVHMFRGFCLHQLGRHADSLPDTERAVELLNRYMKGDTAEKAAATNQLAVCLLRLGRGEEAFGHMRQVVAMQRRIAGGKDAQGLAKALNDTSFCLLALGRPAEALELSKESVAMGRRLHPEGHPGLAAAIDNLASCYDDLGRFPEALEVREQTLAMALALHEGDHQNLAQSLANSAHTLRFLGRTEEALNRFTEALDMFDRLFEGDHREIATAMNNLAMCLLALGHREEALPLQEQALAMARRLNEGDHPDVAMMQHNLAVNRMALGRLKEALADLDAALAMRTRIYPDGHPDVAGSMNEKAQCLRRLGRLKEGIALMREALAMARRHEAAAAHRYAANLAVMLLREGKRIEEAAKHFGEAIVLIEEQRRSTQGMTALDRAAYLETLTHYRAYDGMVRAQLRLGRPDEALRYLEQGRARTLLDLLERSRIDPVEEVRRRAEVAGDSDTLDVLRELTKGLESSAAGAGLRAQALAAARARTDLSSKERRKLVRGCVEELDEVRAAQRRMRRELARVIASGWDMAAIVSPSDIQAMLSPDERLLAYSVNDLDGVVLLVPPTGGKIQGYDLVDGGGAPLDEEKLLSLVDEFMASILKSGRAGPTELEEVTRTGHALFGAVVPPALWKALKGVRRVYLVPHRSLHRIPFEALVVERGRKLRFWLDAGPEIAYGASGASLLWSRRRREEQRAGEPLDEAVALGDPVFAGKLDPLPGSRREVEAMRKHLDPAKVVPLLGKEATEAALYSAAPRARWLHIATHKAVAGRAGYLFSGLALTAPASPTPEDDGCLRLLDLFERWRGRLDRCELVVLSACETQVGKELAEEGVFALPWGFQFAGAPSVIASLWLVDDDSTAELFGQFYRRLRKGKSALVSLTAARKALRRANPQPYLWAPFIFLGVE